MSVDSTHPQYDAYIEQWRTMRDFAAGEEAVKKAGTRYLPMLGGQGEDSEGRARYDAYKTRAAFFNATGRTIDGLSGMIFRKEPIVEHPDAMDAFMADVTLGGLDFQGFAEGMIEEVLTPSRAGILVDFPRVEAGGLTQAEADRMNLRPFWSLYRAEVILNWRTGQIGNRTVLTQVRVEETVNEAVDEFEDEEIKQIRVLDLDENTQYRQRVYRKDKDKKEWEQFGDDIFPEMRGQRLDFIPFIFVSPRDTTPNICKPALIDLANANAKHYHTSADLKHGLHFAALPTPWRTGVGSHENVSFEIGPEAIWDIESENAKVGMLEFTGAGLKALENYLDREENHMAALGARMLAPEKRAAEAAETAAIHRQGEMSVLASISMASSIALTKALEIARDWMGLSGDVNVSLNTDFNPKGMDPQMFTAWVQAVQSGEVTGQEFFDALQEGEMIRADKTYEEHQAEQEERGPALGMLE